MPRVANSRSATSISMTRVDSPEALRRRAPAADSMLVMDLLRPASVLRIDSDHRNNNANALESVDFRRLSWHHSSEQSDHGGPMSMIWTNSGDSHFLEPDDLWQSRLPKALAELTPHAEKDPDGEYETVSVDGQIFRRKLPSSAMEAFVEESMKPQGNRALASRSPCGFMLSSTKASIAEDGRSRRASATLRRGWATWT